MLIQITVKWPEIRRGSKIFPARKKVVVKDFSNSPFLKVRGTLAAMLWAQGEFPCAEISITTLTSMPPGLSPALAAEIKK